ncbi:hypothetical protein TVAG_481380 [Trichomonas vaginalis G3]|uniref:Uncharacterized protein n=1 Tax=Trichomonas vaginalis (strain ATCC PRA-98 / G3) TaxID=412133 RepID=A2F213_TRIV3|nr:hypothetical protein TVAGG3_0477310 [Trichomonas vaginalis G3]EAY01068.1 hypothetical protein TVAG_481380 [Trichomonas vaginalis G3]KAI5515495.1 hypothetical protein TVAGG3_0477310 [Trichomonas vaginalis G3]|eukprot:XP_001330089.1 hypothetical protein [Trichomonas vaginalis G3]
MSVNYINVAEKFQEHFLELAKKTENIQPFFTEKVKAKIFDEEVEGVQNVLKKYEPLLPFNTTKHPLQAQPIQDGLVLTTVIEANSKKLLATFQLKEVDSKTHQYGITGNILANYE